MSIIGVDCDNTVVSVDQYWWDWLNSICRKNKPFPTQWPIHYDLSTYFREELAQLKMDGKEWWRGTTQYDLMQAMPEAIECLERLSGKHEIVFVSSLKGHHAKSKYYFLKRQFPFLTEVTFMKKKRYAAVDVLIDDRVEHHNNAPPGRMNILFDTPLTQIEEITQADLFVSGNWYEIEEYLWRNL